MKKLIALLLALALLLAASAFAETLPYIWQLPQYTYVRVTLMTEESYPEVRLIPTFPFRLFTSNPIDPLFLCFPGPEGASVARFDSYSAHYLDVENQIQYTYNAEESDSFEEFINDAAEEQYILLDGASGVAACIEPEDGYAYGMIATKEFGKSAKLWIRLNLGKLDSKMPLDTRVESLSAAILTEVERVCSQMHYETYAPYWSSGQFAGIKILDYSFQKLCRLDFPVEELMYEDGGAREASFFVTKVDGTKLEGIYSFDPDLYVEVEVDCDSFSYPASKLEEQDPNACRVTLDDGSEWLFYSDNINDDGSIYSWHASKVIDGLTDHDRPMYLTLHYSGNRIQWTDLEDCMQSVAKWEAGMTFVDPADDPYVAPVKTVPTEAPAEVHEAEGWTCPGCGAENNTGNFCGECGTARPEPETIEAEDWICPNCGTENRGNFCGECGTPRPEESAEWICPGCGQTNEGNFCPNCGTARPQA